jgi:nickel-dependent lactate racemase
MPCGGEDLRVEVPDRNVLAFLLPTDVPALADVDGAVRAALAHPEGSTRLSDLAASATTVALLLDSWKRPTKHYMILPAVLDELRRAGIKDDNVKLVFGNGVHRHATRQELEGKLGEFIERFEIVQHNRTSPTAFVGITKKAANPVWINAEAAKADLKVAVGNIGFNILAGYSGGGKMICPGIASFETINLNHRLDLSPAAMSGEIEQNPVRIDLEEMARLAGLDFIVNVVHNRHGQIVHVVAGDPIDAHRAGVGMAAHTYRKPIPERADIYLASANPRYTTGGAPIDDLPWAVLMADRAVRPGGTMILAHKSPWPEHPYVHAKCPFFKECEHAFMSARPDPEQVLLDICRGEIPGWISCVYMVSKIMTEKDVLVVNPHFTEEGLRGSGWQYQKSVEAALDEAFAKHGRDAKVIVAPFGGRMTLAIPEA